MIILSPHFYERKNQRGLRKDVMNFILEFGEIKFAKKGSWLVVENRRLPLNLRNSSLAKRATQWLLMLKDGVLITCYRHDNPIRSLRLSH